MNIALGIHIGHDRGACIIKDAKVLACIPQERIDRIKYSSSSNIPFDAIDKLLEYCSIDINDISCVGLSYDGIENDSILNIYKSEFFEYYFCNNIPFYFVSHHDAHAYASFFSSGFEDALVFVADGGGDYHGDKQESESLYVGCANNITLVNRRLQDPPIRRIGDGINHIFPQMPTFLRNHQISVGRKYEQFTHLLGFGWGEAGKTMGLASYGKSLIDFTKLQYDNLNFSLTYGDMIDVLYGLQTLSGKSFKTFIKDERANIARTIQEFTENTICSLIKNFADTYKCKNICLSGGVFLNCLTNQKIIDECKIDNVFILPSAGDDGQALGCAYYAYNRFFENHQKFEIDLPYLGLSYSNEKIQSYLNDRGIKYQFLEDNALISKIARCIADNKIGALHRGRTEIGPRALCHRSIIANPTNPKMKDILNKRVKHREEFRPFAPTTTYDSQYELFNLKTSSDYMLLAATVKEEHRKKLPAITHVDNTARIQAVSKEKEPFLFDLLTEIEKHTDYPVLLNTSFNVAGMPIVESPSDAINTFIDADIDFLAIGNFFVDKSNLYF